jgi:hypothetical protein
VNNIHGSHKKNYNDGNVDDNRIQLAQSNYVEIKLPLGTVSGLIDSGSELNVIKQGIIHKLDFDSIGEVEFRGVIDEPVRAQRVRIPVLLNDEVLDENDNVSTITLAASSGNIDIDNSDVTYLDIDELVMNVRSDIGVSNATEFSEEQLADVT